MVQIEVDYSFFLSVDHAQRRDSWVSDAQLKSEQSIVNFDDMSEREDKKKKVIPQFKKKRLVSSDGHAMIAGVNQMSSLHLSQVMQNLDKESEVGRPSMQSERSVVSE